MAVIYGFIVWILLMVVIFIIVVSNVYLVVIEVDVKFWKWYYFLRRLIGYRGVS